MASSISIPRDLPSLIAKQYDSALSSGSAFFYPSDVHTVSDKEGEDGPSMQWTVRRCEALREKAKEKKRKEEAKSGGDEPAPKTGGQNPSDVFAPPYDKDCKYFSTGMDCRGSLPDIPLLTAPSSPQCSLPSWATIHCFSTSSH